jgi:hypothetical protein
MSATLENPLRRSSVPGIRDATAHGVLRKSVMARRIARSKGFSEERAMAVMVWENVRRTPAQPYERYVFSGETLATGKDIWPSVGSIR